MPQQLLRFSEAQANAVPLGLEMNICTSLEQY
jgi:hypothetical protein